MAINTVNAGAPKPFSDVARQLYGANLVILDGKLASDLSFYGTSSLSSKNARDRLKELTNHLNTEFAVNSFQGAAKIGGLALCMSGFMLPSMYTTVVAGGDVPQSSDRLR